MRVRAAYQFSAIAPKLRPIQQRQSIVSSYIEFIVPLQSAEHLNSVNANSRLSGRLDSNKHPTRSSSLSFPPSCLCFMLHVTLEGRKLMKKTFLSERVELLIKSVKKLKQNKHKMIYGEKREK
jgi:hypothetical protein